MRTCYCFSAAGRQSWKTSDVIWEGGPDTTEKPEKSDKENELDKDGVLPFPHPRHRRLLLRLPPQTIARNRMR